jgi:hypothetical protein
MFAIEELGGPMPHGHAWPQARHLQHHVKDRSGPTAQWTAAGWPVSRCHCSCLWRLARRRWPRAYAAAPVDHLLLAAAGAPKAFPNAAPRRVVQHGFLALFTGIVILIGAVVRLGQRACETRAEGTVHGAAPSAPLVSASVVLGGLQVGAAAVGAQGTARGCRTSGPVDSFPAG